MSDNTGDDGKKPPVRVGDWVITADGLDSRVTAGPHKVMVDYFIERERLLKQHYRHPRVSDWAMHLASKSWITTPAANAAMVDAVLTAIEHHHPDQNVVDAAETRAAAEQEWERTHKRPPGGAWEYDVASGTLAPLEFDSSNDAVAAASAAAKSAPVFLPNGARAVIGEAPTGAEEQLGRLLDQIRRLGVSVTERQTFDAAV